MVYSDTGRCAVPDPAARSQFRLTSVQTAKGVTSRSRDLRGRQANLIRIVSLARRLHTSEFSCSACEMYSKLGAASSRTNLNWGSGQKAPARNFLPLLRWRSAR